MKNGKLDMNELSQVIGGAEPKRKTSQAKTSSRKSANMKKQAPGLGECPVCHEPVLPHRACPNCGYKERADVPNV